MMKNKIFFYIIIFFIFFIISPARAFSINPAKIFVTIDSGGAQEVVINLKNDEQQKNFFSEVVGMRQDAEGHSIFLKNIDEAENWVKIENNKIAAGPLEEVKIIFNIEVPEDIPPGPHYLGLLIGPFEGGENNIGVQGKLAAVLILQVAGEARESVGANIKSPDYFFGKRNWNFFLDLKNSGNIDIPLKINTSIVDWRGKIVLNGEEKTIDGFISQSERRVPVAYSPNIIWPGLYELRVKLEYGRTHQTLALSKNIWYFPWWFSAASITVFASVLFLFFRRKKYVLVKK